MNQLLRFLQRQVIPSLVGSEAPRLVVARPQMRAAELPVGATLSRHKIKGRRVLLKNRRKHANQRLHIAEWPDANLHEIALPKLACIVSGEADYLLGEYSLRCGEGTFILIPPRAPHQRSGPFLDSDELQKGHCTLLQAYAYKHGVFVWLSRSRGAQHRGDLSENYLIPNMAAVQIFNLLLEEAIAAEENFEVACKGLMMAFFTLISREIAAGRYRHPGPETHLEAPSAANTDFSGQLHELIAANFNKPLKIEDVAAQMYLSTPQFCRRVRAETGETFGELLTRYRIERACELLRETDWTAAAIAGFIGFRSAAHFQQLFRRRIGSTPIAYRQQK
jgi:AraC-like DNA-binding protein